MADLCCDLQVRINGQQTFFLNQRIIAAYSGRLRKMIKRERKNTQMGNLSISLEDFPGGSNAFELVSSFCYNNGAIPITARNVSTLYCAAVYLGMTEKLRSCNLLQQSETFLEGMFYWCWDDVLACLSNCDPFFLFAESCGLVDKLITTLLAKIAQNSDILFSLSSNSSSSSSPDNPNNSSGGTNSSGNGSNTKAWWFDDLATLSPMIIEKVIKNLGAYGSVNNSLLLTKFLLHYLKVKKNCTKYPKTDYSGLSDTAVYGVILMGKTAFSCRALFWVLRLVSGYGLSKVCRSGLERLIGSMLDLAKLDDLLVSGNSHNNADAKNGYGGVYDVNLVVRLIRVFVQCEEVSLPRLQKVGWLIDQYLAEISPDQNLKVSKFIGVAQSLPDLARDCFDGVYRAIDIYLQSHPSLSFEERSRLCRCLNYEKLSLEACKDLAKNPRIPPRVAVQALASQRPVNYEDSPTKTDHLDYSNYFCESPNKKKGNNNNKQIVVFGNKGVVASYDDHHGEEEYEEERESSTPVSEGSEDMKLNIQRMQWRVLELEKLCKEMKGQMSRLVRHNSSKSFSSPNRPPRLCCFPFILLFLSLSHPLSLLFYCIR